MPGAYVETIVTLTAIPGWAIHVPYSIPIIEIIYGTGHQIIVIPGRRMSYRK